jgi:hypothetical protein
MLVRDQAKRHLISNGLTVKEERFQILPEPLISLLILANGYAIRVLKGKDGIIPGCGLSGRRRKFYNQASMRYLDPSGKIAQTHTNLILLWDFNTAFGIQAVWLACPQIAGARSQDVVLAWKESIQNPVVEASALVSEKSIPDDTDRQLEALLTGKSENSKREETLPIAVGQSVTETIQGKLHLEMEFEEHDGDDRKPNQTGS